MLNRGSLGFTCVISWLSAKMGPNSSISSSFCAFLMYTTAQTSDSDEKIGKKLSVQVVLYGSPPGWGSGCKVVLPESSLSKRALADGERGAY